MGTPTDTKARRGRRGRKAANRMTVAEARRAALAALAAAEARRARFAEAEAERVAEFYRRYPYDEWYTLNAAELAAYRRDHPDADPYPWQAPQPDAER